MSVGGFGGWGGGRTGALGADGFDFPRGKAAFQPNLELEAKHSDRTSDF